MNIIRIAAFEDGNIGGNPAGVVITEKLPSSEEMQSIAFDIGYSETVFAEPMSAELSSNNDIDNNINNTNGWRVRYFSPESEVPFCGHATIALGAALAMKNGPGVFPLQLNDTSITVEGFVGTEVDNKDVEGNDNVIYSAALQSPETKSEATKPSLLKEALELFGYSEDDLDPQLPPAFANGGANHLIIGLNSRNTLSDMDYDLDIGRAFMNKEALITVMFVTAETPQMFHSRNAFASGGVLEDPATGAATAAFAGYLRDIQWPHDGQIEIIQGEDMGSRSLIHASFRNETGSSIRVSGSTRLI